MALGSSGRIRGITIEIGGNTTKLEKALAGVNQSLKTTGSALRDVNKLLKLNPANTELLTQKQNLLRTAISDTRDKLKQEEDALARLKASSTTGEVTKEQQALEREIIDTRNELKNLESQYATFGTVGAQKLQAAGKAMEDYGAKITKAGKTLTTKVTAPIVGVGAAAVKTTADFDAQMSKVGAISGAEGKEFDALRNKAREMGAQTKFSATESAQAMEYMAMAGWKTDDMLVGLEGIMNLAAASGEDLGTTSDIVTDGLTAFGLSASESGRFADVLAATSANANTNVSMLGESFKYAAPVAGALGYSVEDTATALGLMANSGIKASQGGTALRTLMTNLSKPTDQVQAAMDRLGISLQNDDGSMKSLGQVMTDLRAGFGQINMPVDEFNRQVADLNGKLESGEITQKQYDKSLEELTKQAYGAEGAEKARAAAMLAGKTGMSGLLAIVNASEQDYNKLTTAINGSGGAAKDMSDKMQNNLSGQLTILKSQVEEAAISVGDVLTPKVKKFAGYIQELVDKFNKLSPKQKEQIVTIAAVAAAIGPVLIVLGSLVSSVGKVTGAVGKLSGAFGNIPALATKLGGALSGISIPALAVVAVIAVLAAAFVHLWKNNEDFRKKITEIWERIKTAVTGFVDGVKKRFEEIEPQLKKVVDAIKKIWSKFCEFLAPIFTGAFEQVANVLETVLGVLTGILDIFIGIFTGDWSQAWEGVKKVFGSIMTGIGNSFKTTADTLIGVAKVIGSNVKKAWTGIKTNSKKIWNEVKRNTTQAAESMRKTLKTKFDQTAKSIGTAWTSVKTKTTTAWSGIKTTVTTGVTNVKTAVTSRFNQIKSGISTAWSNVKSATSKSWTSIKSAVDKKVNSIKDSVTSRFTKIKDTATGAFSKIKTHVISSAESIRASVSSKFSTLKQKIQDSFSKVQIRNPFGALVSAASSAIARIKSLFNITLDFPTIKLPKLDVEGKFSLNPPSVPKFSLRWVRWYKKAYDNPYLFTRPTIMGGRGFGDGGGSGEIVYGRDQLMRDIAQVTSGNGVTINVYGSEGMSTKALARDIKNEFVRIQNQQARAWA